jgi:hypothetical protein
MASALYVRCFGRRICILQSYNIERQTALAGLEDLLAFRRIGQ